MKLKQAIEGYTLTKTAGGLDPKTIHAARRHLLQMVSFLDNPEASAVKSEDLAGFYAYLRTEYFPRRFSTKTAPLKSSTLNNFYADISAFWRWTEAELHIPRPDLNIERPEFWQEQIEPFTKDQIDALLKKCSFRDPLRRNRALLLVLLDTGLRVGELSRLDIRHVGLTAGEVVVDRYGTGRKTHGRVVFLSKITRQAVWKYLANRGEELRGDDPLFAGQGGRRMSTGSVYQLLQRIGTRAGVADCHPHRFRHTFAIEYLRGGGDVFTLQRLLGHTTMTMVRHYLALADSDSQEAHRKASPVDRWKL